MSKPTKKEAPPILFLGVLFSLIALLCKYTFNPSEDIKLILSIIQIVTALPMILFWIRQKIDI